MLARATLLSLALATAPLAAPAGPGPVESGDLEPYRAFARGPEGARLLAVARRAMERYWGEAPAAAAEDTTEVAWPAAPVGVYVSLVDAHGTRACVGSAAPFRGGLARTVRDLALEALRSDPRRAPIRRDELPRLRLVIAFAGPGEAVPDPMTVDPGREGLLISGGGGSLALLPGEARTISWALREARRVGIISGPDGTAAYRRFPVVVLAEPPPVPTCEEDSDGPP